MLVKVVRASSILLATFLAGQFTGRWLADAQNNAPTEQLATVMFRVIDDRGVAVYDCRIDRFTDRQGHEMASHFRGLRGTQIPYGMYSYVLKRQLHGGEEAALAGRVSSDRPENLIVITANPEFLFGASIDRAIPYGFVIRGRLQPAPSHKPPAEPVWIRLYPIFGTPRLDITVDPSGEFRIFEPLAGQYVLTVIQGEEILHVRQVVFEEGLQLEDLVVNLSEKSAPVLHVRKKAP